MNIVRHTAEWPSTKGESSRDSDSVGRAQHTSMEASSRHLERMEDERREAVHHNATLEEVLWAGQLSYSVDSLARDQQTYNNTRDRYYQNRGVIAGLLHAINILEQETERMRADPAINSTEAAGLACSQSMS